MRFILSLCFEGAKTEPLDAGKDAAGCLGPAEGFRAGFVSLDVGFDRGFELAYRAEHAALEGRLGQQREEALDPIDP